MKISVVIPTFKRPDMLKRLLESILAQTLLPLEIIIVDDCSPDQESYDKVVDQFKHKNVEINYHSLAENAGAPACRNLGIRMAKGDWIALVDDDDEWLPMKLAEQVNCIQQSCQTNVGLIYTWTDVVQSNCVAIPLYRATFSGRFLNDILHQCFIPSPSVLVKKEALLQAGLFDIDFPSCQDWDMWVRIAKAGFTCDCVQKVCTLYHKHGGESIGLSPRATMGYFYFYRKHLLSLLLFAQWRHIIRFIRLFWRVYYK